MNPRSLKLLILLLFLLTLLSAQTALADTGPKPTMEFDFKHEPDVELQIISGILYECDQSDCSDAAALEQLGPQGLYCDTESCSATAYGFAPYHRLEVEFSDEITRQSNIFETAGFDSKYTVTVRPDDLLVEAQFSLGFLPRTGTVILACLCCLAVLGLIVGASIFMIQRSRKN
ncbi:MAG TPA: hypothetical protein VFR47_02300 [Anaerolineales bacterium]|nr:hypothetical protein [Anaerolineales bacterium]